jgi:hypothetical protein
MGMYRDGDVEHEDVASVCGAQEIGDEGVLCTFRVEEADECDRRFVRYTGHGGGRTAIPARLESHQATP